MKITYLGTAAAEGMPAVFCNCEFCRQARALGGKNIRTRSQTLINDDLLIDLPADTYSHLLTNGIEGDRIRYLFMTHSHPDHLYPLELEMRQGVAAHEMRVEKLRVFCGRGVYDKLESQVHNRLGFEVTQIKAFETVCVDGYEVTALPARHFDGDDALFYVIKGDKTLLYAHDTGFFYEEVFEYFRKNSLYFDMLSLDCTNVDIPIPDQGSHMGLENIERLMARLTQMGMIDEKTVSYINHFSHNANPLQHVLEERVKGMGLQVAYDGLSISI